MVSFDYMTPPVANELVPLDEVLGEFSAPLAALAAVVNQPLDQIVGDLVLEDRDGLADDSGLQLAGSDAPIIEPDRTLAVTSFMPPVQEYFQEYSSSAIRFGSLPGSNRGSGFAFANVSPGDEGLNRDPAFPFARTSSSGDERLSLLRATGGPPAFGPLAPGSSSPGVTNGLPGEAPLDATNSLSGETTPNVTTGSSGEGSISVTNGSSGESTPGSHPTDDTSDESGSSPDEPADGGVTEGGIIGTPFDDIFPIADHDNFQALASIDGREGLDTILGTDGNDVLDFRATDAVALISIERIDGGRGNDTIIGPESDVVIQARLKQSAPVRH